MSMLFTTGNGTLVNPNDPEQGYTYILDVDHPDSDASCYSTSAGTALDIIEAMGLETENGPGHIWPLAEFNPKLDALLSSPENDGDYPFAQAERVRKAIAVGVSHGATHLLLD